MKPEFQVNPHVLRLGQSISETASCEFPEPLGQPNSEEPTAGGAQSDQGAHSEENAKLDTPPPKKKNGRRE